MTRNTTLLQNISLSGLELAPSQVCGAIRLVPLLRHNSRSDLRLSQHRYGEDLTAVALNSGGGQPRNTAYYSYVPHGMVLSWTPEGQPTSVYGTRLAPSTLHGKRTDFGPFSMRLVHRMAKREQGSNQLRFLPLHLAMEGFLSLFFGGPSIAWSEYSRDTLANGLSCRSEVAYGGQSIAGLAEALRVFEIHEGQVGMLVFVAEALASAYVVPCPEDYRALHSGLLEDFYGELLYQYALLYDTTYPVKVTLDANHISNLNDLRSTITQVRSEWADYHGVMAGNLLERGVDSSAVYQPGPFTLQRFITSLNPMEENHFGEAIVRDTGEIEYLKTYRLSAAQTRRAFLLSQLAAKDWDLIAAADALGTTYHELVSRLEHAGFGYLFKNNVLEVARRNVAATYATENSISTPS